MKKIYLALMLLSGLFIASESYAQYTIYAGGDTCETAVPIPVGEGFQTPEDGYHGPPTADTHDHWYYFTAPCNGELTISNAGPNESDKRILSGVCGSLTMEAEGTWADGDLSYDMLAGEKVYLEINDSWDYLAQFSVQFDSCEVDSSLLDIQGIVYYDLNNNGVRDISEMGQYLTNVISDPAGIYAITNVDGHYYSPVSDLPDGTYEISPVLEEYWGVSSDSAFYTIMVDPDFEQRDSLDFGLYPETIFHEVTPELVGGYPRCNDTINYWLNYDNTGTTIPSGLVHLELDDSLYYVDAAIAPDSIVGQNIYWSYTDLFYGASDMILVEVGTPDGFEDIVTSNLTVNVDSAGVELYTATSTLTQTITCAYDPNTKTPTPLGEGEMGFIDPETAYIDYQILFQNTGTDTAINVVIEDQLDENLDWGSIEILGSSHFMTTSIDMDGNASFEFDNIMLPDSNVNFSASIGYVKYRLQLKEGLPLGTSIYNTAEIYFDLNPPITTNTTVNTLYEDNSIITYDTDQSLMVYPNPFTESTTIVFTEDLQNYAIRVVDMLGNEVYVNTQLNGNQLEIDGEYFTSGIYLLMLIDKDLNEVKTTTKLVVK